MIRKLLLGFLMLSPIVGISQCTIHFLNQAKDKTFYTKTQDDNSQDIILFGQYSSEAKDNGPLSTYPPEQSSLWSFGTYDCLTWQGAWMVGASDYYVRVTTQTLTKPLDVVYTFINGYGAGAQQSFYRYQKSGKNYISNSYAVTILDGAGQYFVLRAAKSSFPYWKSDDIWFTVY